MFSRRKILGVLITLTLALSAVFDSLSAYSAEEEASAALEATESPAAAVERAPADGAELISEVEQWFMGYDQIRRKAQMNAEERKKADHLLSQKWKLFLPGFARVYARKLLRQMSKRYELAVEELAKLSRTKETEELYQAYLKFFTTAEHLFEDNLRVLSNPFAKGDDGKLLRKSLLARKTELEEIEAEAKELDKKMRAKYGISDYSY